MGFPTSKRHGPRVSEKAKTSIRRAKVLRYAGRGRKRR